jgi:putative transposase
MPQYTRAYIPGGTFFFTVALLERRRALLTEHSEILGKVFRRVQVQRPFSMEAIVVLPDHLHCLWVLPPEDADFSTRWRLIKTAFARQIAKGERLSPRRKAKGERGIWQRRFWEHAIRDESDFARHVDYIHFNPVKHGYAQHPSNWPYSSFHRYVRRGVLPLDWAAGPEIGELEWE